MPLGVTNFPGALDIHANDGSATPETFSEMPRLFETPLLTALTNSGTSLNIISTAALPSNGVIMVDQEVCIWTAKPDSTHLTIVRGRFGTTAVSHEIGSPVCIAITAGQYNAHSAAIAAIEAKLGFGVFSQVPAANSVLLGTGVGTSDHTALNIQTFDNTVFFRKLASVTLLAPSSNLDFTGISSAFKQLLFVMTTRGTDAAVNQAWNVIFNNDTGANYDREVFAAVGSTLAAANSIAANNLSMGGAPCAGAAAGLFSIGMLLITNYTNTSEHKHALNWTAYCTALAANGINAAQRTFLWRNTAAINRVTFQYAVGNFDTGSVITMYGFP